MTEDSAPHGAAGARPDWVGTGAVFYFLLALGGVVWIGLEQKSIPLELFVRPSSALADLGLGVATGAGLLLMWSLCRRLLPAAEQLDARLRGVLHGITTSEAITLAFLSGFAEEFFFRGAVQGSMGWVWATLVFAAIHMGPDRIVGLWSLYALVAGAIFALLTEWRDTILPATIAHILVNGVQLVRFSQSSPAIEMDATDVS